MIVAGFGFRAGATRDSLASALAATGGRPGALAAPEDKCASPAMIALAASLGLPLLAIPPDRLAAARTRTQSAASRAARATGSVAEAAALIGAGPGARLISERSVSSDRHATCALATGDPE